MLITAFILDRVYRIRSAKDYKEAKEAQIENLKLQLELERKNNDIELTEMHKKRYESLKVLLDEREMENSLDTAARKQIVNDLLAEINTLSRRQHTLEIERKMMMQELNIKDISVN